LNPIHNSLNVTNNHKHYDTKKCLNTLVLVANGVGTIKVRVDTRIGLVSNIAIVGTSSGLVGATMVVAAASSVARMVSRVVDALSTSLVGLLEGSGGSIGAAVTRQVNHLGLTGKTALANIVIEVVLLAAVAVDAGVGFVGDVAVMGTVVGGTG
jgi:hypothetical protein